MRVGGYGTTRSCSDLLGVVNDHNVVSFSQRAACTEHADKVELMGRSIESVKPTICRVQKLGYNVRETEIKCGTTRE